MREWIPSLLTLASVGCIRDSLVQCGDVVCPTGSICYEPTSTCVKPESALIVPEPFDFTMGCGQVMETVMPLRNVGEDAIHFTIETFAQGLTIAPSEGELPPHGSLDLQITVAAPPEADPGTILEGSIFVVTEPEVIKRATRLTLHGAVLATSVQTLDFGELPLFNTRVRTLVVSNSGDEATELTISPPATPSPYMFGTTPTPIAAASNTMIDVSYMPGTLGTNATTLPLSFTGTMCRPPPPSITLNGTATGDPILVDQLVLDFGTAACGTQAASLPFTLTSNLSQAQTMTFSASGSGASRFLLPANAPLPMGPNGMVTSQVTRTALNAPTGVGEVTAQMVATAVPDGTTKNILLRQKISAPIIRATSGFLGSQTMPTNTELSGAILIENLGNVTANVIALPSGIMVDDVYFSITPSVFVVPPGGSTLVQVTIASGDTPRFVAQEFFFGSPGNCGAASAATVEISISIE